MKKVILLLLLIGLFVTGCSSTEPKKVNVHNPAEIETKKISVEEVKDIIDNPSKYEDYDIIDVRTEKEFDEGHIEGAINIPLDIIENTDISKDRKIVLYCRSGNRSNQAAIILGKLGYDNVFDMGGIIDWPYEVIEKNN